MHEIDEDLKRTKGTIEPPPGDDLPNLGKAQIPRTGDVCHCENCDRPFLYVEGGKVLFTQRFCSRECENRYYEWKD